MKLPGTYVEYRCYKSKTEVGNCRGRIFDEIGTEIVILKIVTDPECSCSDYKILQRGLGSLGNKHFDNVMKDEPDGTTKTNTNKMICCMVKETSIDTSTHVARSDLRTKINNRTKYRKKVERETSLIQIPFLGHLMDFKQKHTFHVPNIVPTDLGSEADLELYGTRLYRKDQLPVVLSDENKSQEPDKQAYRSMICLDGNKNEDETCISSSENRLYKRIKELQQQKTNSPHIPAYAETTVISSLALLWNLKECEKLGYEVSGSADGAANMVANDLKFLNFGCFSVNEKGIRSFRPFIYVLCPSESELYFSIGIVTLLKYARQLFGIRDFNFKGLLVSDHAGAFVNVYNCAFPESTVGQCYPHLVRKFLTGKGK